MNKKINLAIILLAANIQIFSQTELESLWEKSLSNNSELKVYSLQKDEAFINKKFSKYEYKPTFVFHNENSFSDQYENIKKYPYYAESYVASSFAIPGGGNFSLQAEYEMNQYIMNSLSEIDLENLGYNQIPSFSFDYTQSLSPFYFHYPFENPLLKNYENQLELSNLTYKSAELYTKKQIASYYIQLRRYSRFIKATNEEINLLKNIVKYLEENKLRGISSNADVWEYQNKFLDYTENLINYTEQKEQLLKNLELLCGIFIFENAENTLPDISSCFVEYDFSLKQYELQNENLNLKHMMDRQNYAPKLGMNGTVSYNLPAAQHEELLEKWQDDGTINWTLGISLEFSFENHSLLKRNKLLYEKKCPDIKRTEGIIFKK